MWGLIQGFRVQGISVSHAASQYLCFSRCSQRPEPIVFGCLEMPFIGHPVDGPKSCMTLRTLNYGNYGIFLIMGNAGFCPSTVQPFTRAFKTSVVHVLFLTLVVWCSCSFDDLALHDASSYEQKGHFGAHFIPHIYACLCIFSDPCSQCWGSLPCDPYPDRHSTTGAH